ncbi:MAG: hypothetical protein L0Z55_05840 [Planctomycetes bacterium]|nr:hypothetical protein [Planctomycetota bacterium]
MIRRFSCVLAVAVLVTGCSLFRGRPAGESKYSEALRSEDPLVVMQACKQVEAERDYLAVPDLIDNLESDDFNIRGWSHLALFRFYHDKPPYAPPFGTLDEDSSKRAFAIRRWREWWETEGRQRFEKEAKEQENATK